MSARTGPVAGRDETGMIVAECPAVPGCVSQGRTEDEAIAKARGESPGAPETCPCC